MKPLMTSILAGAACALVLAIPAAAADKPPITSTTARSAMLRSGGPPENLSGTITMADPKEDLVVIQGPDGVPFDMTITPRTHIWSGLPESLAPRRRKVPEQASLRPVRS
jgi:hypothetical protein